MRNKNIKLKLMLWERGKTQRELSKETGIAENQISQHITGRFNFSNAEQKLIAKALGEKTMDLFNAE